MRALFRIVLSACAAAGLLLGQPAVAADTGSGAGAVGASAPSADAVADAIAQLPQASYADKRELIQKLLATRDGRVRPLLQAMLDGNLYTRTGDGKVFITAPEGDRVSLTDPLTSAAAGSATEDQLAHIGVNNQLRKELRGAIAEFQLSDPDRGVRLAAVNEMLRSLDEATVAVLRTRLSQEQDAKVQQQIRTGLAMADLDSADARMRLAAVQSLSGVLSTEAFNRLSDLLNTETDTRVRAAALSAVQAIQHSRALYGVVQTLLFGLSTGSILVLAAIGLAITFGVMGVINMAHGELMMLGAYATYVMQQLMPHHVGTALVLAIPASFLVSGLVGIAIERGIVRFLYGRPLETLLATFGVSLILQQAVRDIFSANNRPVEAPSWLSGSLDFNDALSITYNRLYIILFTLAVFALLLLILKRTRLGLEVRAVSQNRSMARAMGIRTEWVDAMTFGLGSGIAGVAGVALSQLTNVGPNLGQSYIVDSFMVVVFGGVGNLWGTQLGGNALGVVNKVLEPYAGAVLAKIFVLVFLILFIQRRPRGLFPQKGRAAEN